MTGKGRNFMAPKSEAFDARNIFLQPAPIIVAGLLLSAAVSVIVLSGAKNLSRKNARIQKTEALN